MNSQNSINKIALLGFGLLSLILYALPFYATMVWKDTCYYSENLSWFLFFSLILLLGILAILAIIIHQAENHRFEEKKREDEEKERNKKAESERQRMKEITEFRQAMERYEKVNGSIKELTVVLKNDKDNTWSTKDQMDQIVRYLKEHETTFDHLMERLNQPKQ